MSRDKIGDIKFTIKSNYHLLTSLDNIDHFNWGYITALLHYSVINDDEYMEAYDYNRDEYRRRGGKK